MGVLKDKVAIVTGAGRGLGRQHALFLALQGVKVVVNDLGGAKDGTGADDTPAQGVVQEIEALGGEAIADGGDVAETADAEALIDRAVSAFGHLDILVNNAGVLRDRVIVNLEDEDWDLVQRVNLRGSFLTLRAAARYWRRESKAGREVTGSVVNTSSESGTFANPGQANYASAKSGVATLTQVAAKELGRYGVRVNAILPRARTRLTEGDFVKPPVEGEFDRWDPANVAPFVAYLASPSCTLTGEVFLVGGSRIQRVAPWTLDPKWKLDQVGRWSIDTLTSAVSTVVPTPIECV